MFILGFNIRVWSSIMSTEVFLAIKHWDNSLGIRLPSAVAREARLHADQRVRITVEEDCIVIRPVQEATPSLAQRLAHFDPQRHGGEVMMAERIGAERW
jgi:antitoxin MazE